MADRIAARVLRGKEFPTPESLQKYLEEHPKADKTLHTVTKSDKPSGKIEEPGQPKRKKQPPPLPGKRKTQPPPLPGKSKGKPDSDTPSKSKSKEKQPDETSKPKGKPKSDLDSKHDETSDEDNKPTKAVDAWKDRFKSLSEKATKFVQKAPKTFKHFLADDDFRREALKEAKSALVKSPKKLMNRLVDTAKHEVHEFKTAASGVKKVLKGGKMTKKEKDAFKEVAFHMALAGATAALAASGPLIGAALFGENIAKHVAIKAVSRSLANIHVLEELGHVGHGVAHALKIMAADKKSDDHEKAMAKLVMAALAKEIEGLKDKDFAEALEGIEDDEPESKTASERVVAKALSLQAYGLEGLLEGKPVTLYHGTTRLFRKFDLTKSRNELVDKFYGAGIFLTPSKNVAERYANANRNIGFDPSIIDDLSRKNPNAAKFLKTMYDHGYSEGWQIYLEENDFVRENGALMESLTKHLRGLDPNTLGDIVEYIIGSKKVHNDTSNGLDEIMNVFHGGPTGVSDWVYANLDEVGLNSKVYRPKVYTVTVVVNNPLVTASKSAARKARAKGFDSVVYYGSDLVQGVPEVAVFNPRDVRIKKIEVV